MAWPPETEEQWEASRKGFVELERMYRRSDTPYPKAPSLRTCDTDVSTTDTRIPVKIEVETSALAFSILGAAVFGPPGMLLGLLGCRIKRLDQ